MNYPITPSETTPETEQATRILLWMDTTILPRLSSANALTYRKYRSTYGQPAITRRGKLFPGSPNLPIPPMPVRGTGDDAFGHNRLALIIDHLVIPMINKDELDRNLAIELQNKCRGEFPRECTMILRALSQAKIRNIRKEDDELLEGDLNN